jgi:cell division protein FtsB
MQKIIFIFLLFLNLMIQYQMWFGANGLQDYWHLKFVIKKQIQINAVLQKRNNDLASSITSFSSLDELVELKARRQFNLIKPGEVIILIPSKSI